MTRLESKSCSPCAMAKRKCGKQRPHCLRCRAKGVECRYPPAKPSQFVLCSGDDSTPIGSEFSIYNPLQLSTYTAPHQTQLEKQAGAAGQSYGLDLPALSNVVIDDRLAVSWFASQDTWKVRFPPAAPRFSGSVLPVTDIKRSIRQIRRWMVEWIEKDSNPFIHTRLYRTRLPRSMQDAYAALSCYLQKTAANERTVFRIIEESGKQLVAKYDNPLKDPSNNTDYTTASPRDSLEHIARVQSLLIYQFMGLYDGDIRLHHLSESYIPVLNRWMQEMVQHASQSPCLGGAVISSECEHLPIGTVTSGTGDENLLWYAWILAESVRRTWVIGSGIHAIYQFLQAGGAVPCQGGMMFTTRQGVWEAHSAMAWEKLCSEVNVGLMQMADADRLFAEVSPDEVNDFTKVVLEVNFGRERMERWGVHVDD